MPIYDVIQPASTTSVDRLLLGTGWVRPSASAVAVVSPAVPTGPLHQSLGFCFEGE